MSGTYGEGYDDGWDAAKWEFHDRSLDDLVRYYLRQIRMGYTLDVTLQDVLEEMERTIRD